MNIERMNRVIEFLENLDEQFFNLKDLLDIPRYIAHTEADIYKDFDNFVLLKPCGTTGCVVGHFPHIFPEDWEYVPEKFDLRLKGSSIDLSIYDSQKYLDITDSMWEFLFEPSSYPTDQKSARDVAARMRWLVDNADKFVDIEDNVYEWSDSLIP